ncbi:MAG: hypothetical protein KatS3mg108_2450 [Isosphaeraceae bacterium]|jgi:hypothetical protein|nr:MAG: hypothetical protein KatS3mg108_2450 [Isosphaeraceae bacterium]
MPVADDDWRLVGWQECLRGVPLYRMTYVLRAPEWDHDHCSFCWATFTEERDPDTLQEGYATADRRHWVCPAC